MFDQVHRESEEIDEMKGTTTTISSGSESQQIKKVCSDCGTNRTPLWRGGPAGPKSLCNACGIRSRKRRRALLGVTNQQVKNTHKHSRSKEFNFSSSKDDGSNSSSTSDQMSGDEKLRCDVMRMGGLTWHRSTARRRGRVLELGEEEQAAVLLMAMAYSSVFV